MIVGHFSVYDRKANSYSPVFSAKNSDVARRMIVQSLNSESVLVQYASDYFLAHLCDFDEESGEILQVGNGWCAVAGELVDLVPDSLKQYNLDGSFKK